MKLEQKATSQKWWQISVSLRMNRDFQVKYIILKVFQIEGKVCAKRNFKEYAKSVKEYFSFVFFPGKGK